MSDEKYKPEEEIPDTGLPLPDEKSEDQESKSEAVSADTLKEDTQPQTSNTKLQTPLMEVHHHGHVHEKKKWKIPFSIPDVFMAVFCGFLT